MTLFVGYLWLELYQVTFSGILRGIGKAHDALISYSVSLYGIGQVLSLILTFYFEMDVLGVWVAMTIAVLIVDISMIVIIVKTDWKKQVEIVRQELLGEKKEHHEYKEYELTLSN